MPDLPDDDEHDLGTGKKIREDLAAAQRLAVAHDMSEGIYNHFTAAVPGCDDQFYISPLGLHWSEVTAGCMMRVNFSGEILEGDGFLLRSALSIHAPIHRMRPKNKIVLHTHMPFASTLVRLQDQRLHPIGHNEALFADQIAYDEDYAGIAAEQEEGERLAHVLGEKKILFMAHHGVLVTGETVAEAYDRLYKLERAAKLQVYALWTGQPLRHIDSDMLGKIKNQVKQGSLAFGANVSGYDLQFNAFKRWLDKPASRNRQ